MMSIFPLPLALRRCMALQKPCSFVVCTTITMYSIPEYVCSIHVRVLEYVRAKNYGWKICVSLTELSQFD